MIRAKRSDTLVSSIEQQYAIDLHARGDMQLGNLLAERGFDSLTQLLRAYRGKLIEHPKKRRVFLSFHNEDFSQISGIRLMVANDRVAMDFTDLSLRHSIRSENPAYIRGILRRKMRGASVLLCLIGNGTAWREWVNWEISEAIEQRKGICGVRLKGARGITPAILRECQFPVFHWGVDEINAAIECGAARRS